MNIKQTLGHLTLLSMSTILVACGGGGNSSTPASSAAAVSSVTVSSAKVSVAAVSSKPASSAAAVSSTAISSAVASSVVAGAKIQVEDYLRFYDTSPGNTPNAHRTDDVDIEVSTDTGGGFNIGYIDPEDWLEYSIDVSKAGTFTADARVASLPGDGVFALELDGVAIGSDFNVSATGGWQH